jgi:hypothetical protein
VISLDPLIGLADASLARDTPRIYKARETSAVDFALLMVCDRLDGSGPVDMGA